MEIRVRVDSQRAQEAFARAPEVMLRHLDQSVFRAALEVARDARRRASQRDLFGTLRESIRSTRVAPAHHRVSTGTNYARAVEEGTRPGKMPNPTHLYAFVKARAAISFGTTKRGSAERQSQYDEIRSRAWALALHIKAHGTKAHPYMAPAVEAQRSRVIQLIEQGVARSLAEAFA